MATFQKRAGGFISGDWCIEPGDRNSRGRARKWLVSLLNSQDTPTTHRTVREAKRYVEAQLGEGPIALQLWGHQVGIPYDRCIELHEVTICATPEGLRVLAQHLVDQAAQMEKMGEDYDHGHFQPEVRPEIVVSRFSEEDAVDIEWDESLDGYKRVE